MEKQKPLILIHCPIPKAGDDGKRHICNRLIVKVAPGSSGEAYCWTCKKRFDFSADTGTNPGVVDEQ